MSDCVHHYRLYKRACVDNIEALKEEDVKKFDELTSRALYKDIVRAWLDAKECVEERRWVKAHCYNNVAERGHDKAIAIAENQFALVDRNAHLLVGHLTNLQRSKTQALDVLVDGVRNLELSTNSKNLRRRKRKKASPAKMPPMVNEASYEIIEEALSKKQEETDRARNNIRKLYQLVLKRLARLKNNDAATWLQQTIPTSVHVSSEILEMMIDSIKVHLPRTDVNEALELLYNADKEDFLDVFVANYVNTEIISLSNYSYIPRSAAIDSFVYHCFSRLYSCGDRNQNECISHISRVDAYFMSMLMGIINVCRLRELSSKMTHIARFRSNYLTEKQREISIDAFVAIATYFHPSRTPEYIKHHIQWELMTITNFKRAVNITGQPIDDTPTTIEFIKYVLELYLLRIA